MAFELERQLVDMVPLEGGFVEACLRDQVIRDEVELGTFEDSERLRLDVLERVHIMVRLVREQTFPDRTLTQRYGFVHVLYQNALYAALPPTRKASWSAAAALPSLKS